MLSIHCRTGSRSSFLKNSGTTTYPYKIQYIKHLSIMVTTCHHTLGGRGRTTRDNYLHVYIENVSGSNVHTTAEVFSIPTPVCIGMLCR